MGRDTGIQWTEATFNPFRGCSKVSPGCTNCYAEALSDRNHKVMGRWGPKGTRVLASESMWKEPLKWNRQAAERGRPMLVFCASLADVFEDWTGQMTDSQERPLWQFRGPPVQYSPLLAPNAGEHQYTLAAARERLWDLIRRTGWLRWQLLTKRPENIPRMMPGGAWPNVWLGTSVESQDYAWRIDALVDAPQEVPVRFVSAEPLLGPLTLWEQLPGIQWVIIGGESGGAARPFHLGWATSLIAQCRDADVPCFLKQVGRRPMRDSRYPLDLVFDKAHGADPVDWPADLPGVRQMPLLT
jgi:protein gp37